MKEILSQNSSILRSLDMYWICIDFKNMSFFFLFLQVLNIVFKGSFCSKGFLGEFQLVNVFVGLVYPT